MVRHHLSTGFAVFAALTLVTLPILAPAALAQATDTTVSVGGFWANIEPFITSIVSAVVAAVLGWLSALISKYIGITVEARHREALHSAVMSGVSAALTRIGKRAQDATIDMKHVVIKDAVLWAQKSVPDALEYLGVTPESLAVLAESKLALLVEAPAGTAPANPAQNVKTL